MQQQQMSTGFIVDGDREMVHGQVARRSFQSGSVHSGARMSRTPSLRPEDAGQVSYPSMSPANQVSYQQSGHHDGQILHRPSAAPVQNWPSEEPMASGSHSSQSMEIMRSQSTVPQHRPRPAPLQLHTGMQHYSRESIQIEHSPFEATFRSASAMGTPTYSQSYQHPGNRLHSIPNMASPGLAVSPLYGNQQAFAYQQQHQHSSPQVTSYTYQNSMPSLQQYAQPYQQQYQQQSMPQQSYTYLHPQQPPQMPPLHHMSHSAPSVIPQQSAVTSAAYQQYTQHRPNLLHSGSFPVESSSPALERPEYTGFSSYPMNRGGDRPHKCDQCTQSFNRNHDLKRHKRIHLEVKPFACNACQKQFSRRDALKRHWLVKNCEGDRSDPNNPAYVPPSGANRKNAAAIPRHYQNASKKALLAKLEKQRQQAQARSEANGYKGSPSPSDRSKSLSPEEDEPMDGRGQVVSDRQDGEFASVPALSPPTPNTQMLSAPPHSAGSMARSVSHNTTLVTPDENSVHIRAGGQSSLAPFVPVHSQTTYSYTSVEKPTYQNSQIASYESGPQYGQGQASSSTSVIGSMLNDSGGAGEFQFRHDVNYNAVSNPSGDNRQSQPSASDATMSRFDQNVAPLHTTYAIVPAKSSVNGNNPQPARKPKDYFDGVVVFDQSTPLGSAADSTSHDIYTDPHTQSQPLSGRRPVFTMPFGSSDGTGEVTENPSLDLSHVKGPWQRWHRPSFPFPVGSGSQAPPRSDAVYDESNISSLQNSLHPGSQQLQHYARSSLRLSHSPNNEPNNTIER